MEVIKLAAAILLAVALWGVFFRLTGNLVEKLRLGIRKAIKYMNND